VAANSVRRVNFGPAALALSAFLVAFFGARIFTTITPDTVVVTGGIHFHHFWYGLGMVIISGWLGIAYTHPAWNRIYATVFGFGGGLIGDEVGLLLTFGNYHSELTYVFFVGFVCVVTLLFILLRYKEPLKRDLAAVTRGEALAHVGIVIVGISTLFFSFDFLVPGSGIALVGVVVALAGVAQNRRSRTAQTSGTPPPLTSA
jgi:hypothetical protein